MEEYFVPSKDTDTEFTERKSRFIGHIRVADKEEDAIAFIRQMREKYWDATHNVYAYIIKDGPTRFSDDGEPQGTAGMPVLDVFRRERIYNVCCVVTRYFGGILLGTGGLVRAYSKSAADSLAASGVSVMRVWNRIEIPVSYKIFERVRQEVASADGILENVEYGAEILIRVLIAKAAAPQFLQRLADISSGRIAGTVTGEMYRAFPAERKSL